MTWSFPQGRIERIYLHWSGGDYTTVFPAYHYCVVRSGGRAVVEKTGDLRANMRALTADDVDYVAHTMGRNSYAAGLAIAGMSGAQPSDFGPYPMTDEQLEAFCGIAAAIARAYAIPVRPETILTHAEAAIVDGYFGCGEDERWDIARLRPSPAALTTAEAVATGDRLRSKIASF